MIASSGGRAAGAFVGDDGETLVSSVWFLSVLCYSGLACTVTIFTFFFLFSFFLFLPLYLFTILPFLPFYVNFFYLFTFFRILF